MSRTAFVAFRIPLKLASEANPGRYGGRNHWAVYRRRNQQYLAVDLASGTRMKDLRPPLRITLTRLWPKGRRGRYRFDPGNLEASFKWVQDALAKKLGFDDGDSRSATWTYDQRPNESSEWEVAVDIEEVDDE